MLRTEKISGRYFAVACCSILLLFFLSIAGRFLVRQIVVKKMGISNEITAAIFWDAPNLNYLPGQKQKERGEQHIAIDWQKRYPFTEGETVKGGTVKTSFSDRYTTKVLFLEKKITDYTSRYLPGKEDMSHGNRKYKGLLAWDINSMNKIKERDMQEIADSAAAFHDWLQERKIPFLYVNVGCNINPWDTEMNAKDYSNDNGDALQAALARRGIAYLDMRQEMHQAGLDWSASYYKHDAHWKTQTAMWAAGVLADKLNHDYGFFYDPKYFQPENYIADTYPWNGEPYTYFLPKFPTQLTVEIPTRGIRWQGEYKDTLFDRDAMEDNRKKEANGIKAVRGAYSNTTWINDEVGVFTNQLPVNNDKKILILQDSFSWYLTTYLALDTAEIDVIHPGVFTGSIRKYVEEMHPDMVIVIYNERNILKINWSAHTATFDFR